MSLKTVTAVTVTGSPNRGSHKRAIAALALGGFGIGTTEFLVMGLLPQLAHDIHVSEPVAGHVVSAYASGVVVGAPLITAAAARMPRKRLLTLLVLAFTIGNLVSMLAPNYEALVLARFLTGLPHAAYFGVAAVAAASLGPPDRRAKAVSMMMLGLTVATVLGVPVSTWAGQNFGWRSAFGIVAVIGMVAVAGVLWLVPELEGIPVTDPRTELGALLRPQVLFAFAVGAVGFGGMMAVYTYIATTLTDVAGIPTAGIPAMLMLYGLGMVTGNLVGGYLADRALIPGLVGAFVVMIMVLLGFVVAAHNPCSAAVCLFLISASGQFLCPSLQTRLMDVAADAQSLAASLNHAALNIANAVGAWLGGVVIAAGLGYTAPAAVGAVLAAAGLAVLAASIGLERREMGATVLRWWNVSALHR